MMIALLLLLALLVSICIFGIYNLTITNEELLESNEALAASNLELTEKLENIRIQVMDIETQLVELDIKGSFEADDEVGFFFKEIRMLNQDLQQTIREQYGESNKA